MLIRNESCDKICIIKTNEYTSEQTLLSGHAGIKAVMIFENGENFLDSCSYEAKKNFTFLQDIDANDEDCCFEIILRNDSWDKRVHTLQKNTYACFREKDYLYIEREF